MTTHPHRTVQLGDEFIITWLDLDEGMDLESERCVLVDPMRPETDAAPPERTRVSVESAVGRAVRGASAGARIEYTHLGRTSAL